MEENTCDKCHTKEPTIELSNDEYVCKDCYGDLVDKIYEQLRES